MMENGNANRENNQMLDVKEEEIQIPEGQQHVMSQLAAAHSQSTVITSTYSDRSRRQRKPKQMKDMVPSTISKIKFVVRDAEGTCPSLKKEEATPKGSHTPSQSPVMIRAEEVQASLDPKFPSCIKLMVKSHVATGFWMGLPVHFCKLYMPKEDATFILENETGEQFELRYIANKTGLSAGWKKFAYAHKLLEGDGLIFYMVETYKFKVFIIRANDLNEVDGALSLLNLDAYTAHHGEEGNSETATPTLEGKRLKRQKSMTSNVGQKKKKKTKLSQIGDLVEHSGNNIEEVGSVVLDGSAISKSPLHFKDVKCFEDFHIIVDGLCIDSELPEQVRMDYYDLCCKGKTFLHNFLPQGVFYKLVAGIIGETVSIANEIKACKLTTSQEEFLVWENSLKSFELLGMKVGFLQDRVHKLRDLRFESEGALDTLRYMEARSEQNRNEDEIKKLEAKLVELKEASNKFDAVVESLKEKAEDYELKFLEEVKAPW